MAKKLVRFDWAMKKMLRHKANFDILEGFLSELLGEEIKIKQILDSESNKETEDDKYNRVDILVEFSSGELVIIEIQDSKEYDYFHRILFGTSKVITEHIKEGEPFASVKKVISITIAYFDLGQGKDYVYHGTTTFQGIHQKDILTLSEKQVELYKKSAVYEIYPEYWLIKVGKFPNTVNDKLDEWIYFFKNAEIKNNFSAKGLKAAGERLVEMKLNEKDQKEYKKYLKHLHEVASGNYNEMVDAQDLINQGIEKGIEKGAEQKEVEAVVGLNRIGLEKEKIAEALGITVERVNQIIENQANK
jgi:predicted transposase/invertase (TIGR01784 family)